MAKTQEDSDSSRNVSIDEFDVSSSGDDFERKIAAKKPATKKLGPMVNVKKPSAKAPAVKKKHESSEDDRQHKKQKSTNRFEDSEDSDFRASEVSAPPRAGGEIDVRFCV